MNNDSDEKNIMHGKKWKNEEEEELLNELLQNIDIETISKNHRRSIGSIHSRIEYIVYNMFINNILIDEIINKTNLSKDNIIRIIHIKQIKNKCVNKPIINLYDNFSTLNSKLNNNIESKDINKNISKDEKLNNIIQIYDLQEESIKNLNNFDQLEKKNIDISIVDEIVEIKKQLKTINITLHNILQKIDLFDEIIGT